MPRNHSQIELALDELQQARGFGLDHFFLLAPQVLQIDLPVLLVALGGQLMDVDQVEPAADLGHLFRREAPIQKQLALLGEPAEEALAHGLVRQGDVHLDRARRAHHLGVQVGQVLGQEDARKCRPR